MWKQISIWYRNLFHTLVLLFGPGWDKAFSLHLPIWASNVYHQFTEKQRYYLVLEGMWKSQDLGLLA